MKTIVVTGGNKGIGFEICRQLCDLGHLVVLTARDEEKGMEAAKNIGATFMKLDMVDQKSISQFARDFRKNHSALDVLINNAGIFMDKGDKAINVDFEKVYQTMETNVYGPWKLIIELKSDLVKSENPRVINISSGLGAMNEMAGGYPSYRLSKVALNALTRMLASEVGDEITINSMCPGWVKTDMGGKEASRSVEKGAETAVWLATEDTVPNGKFLRDKKVIEW